MANNESGLEWKDVEKLVLLHRNLATQASPPVANAIIGAAVLLPAIERLIDRLGTIANAMSSYERRQEKLYEDAKVEKKIADREKFRLEQMGKAKTPPPNPRPSSTLNAPATDLQVPGNEE